MRKLKKYSGFLRGNAYIGMLSDNAFVPHDNPHDPHSRVYIVADVDLSPRWIKEFEQHCPFEFWQRKRPGTMDAKTSYEFAKTWDKMGEAYLVADDVTAIYLFCSVWDNLQLIGRLEDSPFRTYVQRLFGHVLS